MPSVNTKPLASRVTKEEYYLLLKEAATKQMTLSQFLKDIVIGSYIKNIRVKDNNLYASRGVKLETPPEISYEKLELETPIWSKDIPKPKEWDNYKREGITANADWLKSLLVSRENGINQFRFTIHGYRKHNELGALEQEAFNHSYLFDTKTKMVIRKF